MFNRPSNNNFQPGGGGNNKGEKGRQRNKRDNEKCKSNENLVTREGKESYEYFNI